MTIFRSQTQLSNTQTIQSLHTGHIASNHQQTTKFDFQAQCFPSPPPPGLVPHLFLLLFLGPSYCDHLFFCSCKRKSKLPSYKAGAICHSAAPHGRPTLALRRTWRCGEGEGGHSSIGGCSCGQNKKNLVNTVFPRRTLGGKGGRGDRGEGRGSSPLWAPILVFVARFRPAMLASDSDVE